MLCAAILLLSGLSEQSPYVGTCSDYLILEEILFPAATQFNDETFYLIATDDVGLPLHNSNNIRFFHEGAWGQINTTEYSQPEDSTTTVTTYSHMNFPLPTGRYYYTTNTDGGEVESTLTRIIDSDFTLLSLSQPTTTYYVEMSCVDENGSAQIYVGIFSLTKTMNPATLENIFNFLESRKIKRSAFRFVRQD